jgi:nucleotide-binding universal stress UspA family protein
MVDKRRSFEEGHRRKFLVVIDGTPECDRALVHAAKRAERTNGGLVLLCIIAPQEFQHWLGVENLMREEAEAEAKALLDHYAERAASVAAVDAERRMREGARVEEIKREIAEDPDIAILVLAAASDREGPGPLVSAIAGEAAGSYPIPVTIVPGGLSDEDIAALA